MDYLVGGEMLGYLASFSRNDIGFPDVVKERRLAVVNMPENGNDGRTRELFVRLGWHIVKIANCCVVASSVNGGRKAFTSGCIRGNGAKYTIFSAICKNMGDGSR